MELTGKIKKIFETKTFNSGFRKREVVLLTQEQYPQTVLVEFLQDRIDLVNSLNEGDEVKISINIRGREWTNPEGVVKYFNSITGWRVEKMTTATHDAPQPPEQEFNTQFADLSKDNDSNDLDDLPF